MMNVDNLTSTDALRAMPAATPAAHARVIEVLTATGFALAGLCFWFYTRSAAVAWLLVGLVTFGMAFDFLNHVLGARLPLRKRLLENYARVNFSALCFGIPFTAYAGSFIIAEATGGRLSVALVNQWFSVLHGSVAFGLLFMFARYREVTVNGAVEFVLDKRHAYTRVIFILRRILLGASLLIALSVLTDAAGTLWLPWALAFTGVFIASIPLHILHKQIPSMCSELLTQMIAMYGCWVVFSG